MGQENSPDLFALFSDLIKALADDPGLVQVNLMPQADGSKLIKVHAPEAEMGKIIGLKGRTARALRTLLLSTSGASSVRYSLDISPLPKDGAQ